MNQTGDFTSLDLASEEEEVQEMVRKQNTPQIIFSSGKIIG